jgi:hypothetical protein
LPGLTEDREFEQTAEGWKHSRDKQFLIRKSSIGRKIDSVGSYALNHETRFVRFLGSSVKSVMHAGIYKKDALPSEIQLLDAIFCSLERRYK